ncbi:MAG: hypothetical protein K2W92_07465, partial [Alphaproteobacteria bacterium]|nr:hypothetical protein [Alphaproteobacteria bacterium]
LRYKETHGEKPTSGQIESMVQISRELETKNYAHPAKELGSHEVEFLRRKEGDFLFRNTSFEGKLPYGQENRHVQTQAKASLEITTLTITRELLRINERDLSL